MAKFSEKNLENKEMILKKWVKKYKPQVIMAGVLKAYTLQIFWDKFYQNCLHFGFLIHDHIVQLFLQIK